MEKVENEAFEKVGKKRKSNENLWKRNIVKTARLKGQESALNIFSTS